VLRRLAQRQTEGLGEGGGTLRPLGRVLGQPGHHGGPQRFGHGPWQRRCRLADVRQGGGDHRLPGEGAAPREELVSHDRQRVDIAGRTRGLALGLLRREVVRRAEDLAGLGHRGAGEGAGDAEVGEPGIAVVVDDDVRGLHVPVDHSRVVRRLERQRPLVEDIGDLIGAEWRPLLDDRRQGLALDELHDEVCRSGTFAEVVHRGDVGVLQARAVSGLGAEPLEEALVVSGVGTQHLDGDMAHQRLVGRSPHLAHSASRDDLL